MTLEKNVFSSYSEYLTQRRWGKPVLSRIWAVKKPLLNRYAVITIADLQRVLADGDRLAKSLHRG